VNGQGTSYCILTPSLTWSTALEKCVSKPTVNILVGLQSGHNYCLFTVSLWFFCRSHLLKGHAHYCVFSVGLLHRCTNCEIDYDDTNDIVLIVIFYCCRFTVALIVNQQDRRRCYRFSVGVTWHGCSMYLYVELGFSKVGTLALLSVYYRPDCKPTENSYPLKQINIDPIYFVPCIF
jgi:hypothetical protein